MPMRIEGDINPLKNRVLIRDLDFGEKITKGGLIVLDDDWTERGIHPRWGQVWKVGSEVTDVEPGEWVLVAHGRWSRTFLVVNNDEEVRANMIDYPDGILVISDENPLTSVD